MNPSTPGECCPAFDPLPWDDKSVTWDRKRFVKDRVTSLFHIPLNFGAVMARNIEAIEAADALPQSRMILSDENSLWGADIYFEVTRDVPARSTTSISGTFLTKVFEGPYSHVKRWVEEMKSHAKRQNKEIQKLYFFYTTCPKCAKKYGKNYVVLLAQV
jgi:hypothetical protein